MVLRETGFGMHESRGVNLCLFLATGLLEKLHPPVSNSMQSFQMSVEVVEIYEFDV